MRTCSPFVFALLTLACGEGLPDENSELQDDLAVTVRYVSPTGLASNPGTLAAPWSLAKANAALKAGERAELLGGVYDDVIAPVNSGLSDSARIVYTNYAGQAVSVRGKASFLAGTVVKVTGKSFISVENLDLSGDKYADFQVNSAIVRAVASKSFVLRRCTLIKANYLQDARLVGRRGPAPRPQDLKDGISVSDSTDALVEGNLVVGWRFAVSASRSVRAVVRNNVLQNNWHTAINIGNYGENIAPVDLSLLIEGNHIGGTMISDGIQTGTSSRDQVINRRIVIRNNYFYYNSEDHIDLKGAGQILIEGNVFTAAMGDNDGYLFNPGRDSDTWLSVTYYSGGVSKGAGTISDGVIIRNNVFYDNNLGVSSAWKNWRTYNNTFVANNRGFLQGWNGTVDNAVPHRAASVGADGATFINNISIDHTSAEVCLDARPVNALLDHNLYFNTTPAGLRFIHHPAGRNANDRPSTQLYFSGADGLGSWRERLASYAPGLEGKEQHSLVGDPQFLSAPKFPGLYFDYRRADPERPTYPPIVTLEQRARWFPFDFHLKASSPAIDHGRHLTRAVNAGTASTVLVVQQAAFFSDGFGARGVAGDTVQLGDYHPPRRAVIKAVDYARNTLTLAAPATWASGDAVSLPYAGAAPDIGAFEYSPTSGGGDDPDTGLVAHYRFVQTGGTTVADASGRGNTATLRNGAALTSGKVDGAALLDGVDDFVEAPASASLAISGQALTLAAWVDFTNATEHQIFIARPASATVHARPYFAWSLHGLRVSASTLTPRFHVMVGGQVRSVKSTVNIGPGWHHVAGVYDGATLRIYVDGAERGSLAAAGSLTSFPTPLRLGTNGGLTEKLKGRLDEVRIYQRALSAAEVAALAQ